MGLVHHEDVSWFTDAIPELTAFKMLASVLQAPFHQTLVFKWPHPTRVRVQVSNSTAAWDLCITKKRIKNVCLIQRI